MNLKMRVMKFNHKNLTLAQPTGLNKMSDLLKNTFRYAFLDTVKEYIPWTHKMCNEEVDIGPRYFAYVHDHLRPREMCEKAVEGDPDTSEFVPDHLKTRGMCERAVEKIYLVIGVCY